MGKTVGDSAAYGNYPTAASPATNSYKEGVFLGYRWFDNKEIEPLFPFGHGLSYTSFEISSAKTTGGSDDLEFTVIVRNTGARSGSEVIQVYIEPPACETPRPPRELKAFAKVTLAPGESKAVTLRIERADLAYWNPGTKQWTVTPGDYTAWLGNSSRNLQVKIPFRA